MNIPNVFNKIGIFVLAMTMFFAVPSYAAWWEQKNIPLPQGAEEAFQEKRSIAGEEFTFTYYRTGDDAAKVKDFFRSQLINSGWKEKELIKDLGNIPNFKLPAALKESLSQNLMFEKSTDTLIINFLPPAALGDGKTRFTIAQGKLDLQKEIKEADAVPKLIAKPKKEVAPLYPQASLISLTESEKKQQAGYFTKDNLEAVKDFYKGSMPGSGWSLKEESPVQENESAVDKNEVAKLCPACAKNAGADIKSVTSRQVEMVFTNKNKAVCNVLISERSASGAPAQALENTTIILVNYEEK